MTDTNTAANTIITLAQMYIAALKIPSRTLGNIGSNVEKALLSEIKATAAAANLPLKNMVAHVERMAAEVRKLEDAAAAEYDALCAAAPQSTVSQDVAADWDAPLDACTQYMDGIKPKYDTILMLTSKRQDWERLALVFKEAQN